MMKVKSSLLLSLSLVLFLLISTTTTLSAESYVYGPGNSQIKSVNYLITKTNSSATYYWWDPQTQKLKTYQVQNSTLFNVTFITDGNPPNKGVEPRIDLELGTLVQKNTTDNTIESNLALGYWKVKENGLITNTNISLLNEKYSALLPNITYSLNTSNSVFLGGTIQTINLFVKDNFQTTFLVYEKTTGLLMKADIVVGNFILSFVIQKINDDSNYFKAPVDVSSQKNLPFVFPSTLLLLLFVSFYLRKKFI